MTFLEMQTMLRGLLAEDSAGNWSTAFLKTLINGGAKNIWNSILEANEKYFVTSTLLNLVANTELYALPSTSRIVVLVERVDGAQPLTLNPTTLEQKDRFQQAGALMDPQRPRWFIVANTIGFAPIPTGSTANAIKIWYVPTYTNLVADGDTFPLDWTSDHHEVVVWETVLWAVARSKEKVDLYKPVRDDLLMKLINTVQNRQRQEPTLVEPPMPDDY